MKIETKYSLCQKVWIINQDTVQEFTVVDISITVRPPNFIENINNKTIQGTINIVYTLRKNINEQGGILTNEVNIFPSKQDLINSL